MATPENLWQRLVDEAGDDAVESAAAVSVGQAERDLVAADFDVKAERARAEARIAELTGGAAAATGAQEPATEPTSWVRGATAPARRSPGSRKAVWLTAALVAAATAGGIFYAAAHRPKPPDKPVEAPSATAPAPAPPPPVAPSQPLPRHEVEPPWLGK
jgi:hypothetical protein